jgi:cyclopropane fatty-acyl-phospholipid synthase-like methyltransferase
MTPRGHFRTAAIQPETYNGARTVPLDMDRPAPSQRFPRSTAYPLEWTLAGGMGSHPLWMAEWLCEVLALRPGMRVLDLGCGRARSSIFLAREFGVQVWATDLWVPARENWRAISEAGLDQQVFPIHADARSLPFAAEFFDGIVAFDSYSYFGTDDLYLNYLTQFVKPGGPIGMAGAGLVTELPSTVPEHLAEFWTQDLWALHSADWWRRHWERTRLVEVHTADAMADGWKLWVDWHHQVAPDNVAEVAAVETDAGRYLTYIRLVAHRRPGMKLEEYAWPDTLRSLLANA